MNQGNVYAGDLLMELEEVDKIIPKEEFVEVAETTTETCNAFFTIYCC